MLYISTVVLVMKGKKGAHKVGTCIGNVEKSLITPGVYTVVFSCRMDIYENGVPRGIEGKGGTGGELVKPLDK